MSQFILPTLALSFSLAGCVAPPLPAYNAPQQQPVYRDPTPAVAAPPAPARRNQPMICEDSTGRQVRCASSPAANR